MYSLLNIDVGLSDPVVVTQPMMMTVMMMLVYWIHDLCYNFAYVAE